MITGGCLCGAVRYEVSQLPDDDVGYFVIFSGSCSAGTFKFTRAEPKYYKSSEWAERGFCPECGTPLVMRSSDGFGVMIGSLDCPQDFPPTSHTGIESQVPWLKINDDLPRWRTEDDPYFVAATKATDDDAG